MFAMKKTILITGATDGIGRETAAMFAKAGHNVILHGRDPKKVRIVKNELLYLSGGGDIATVIADLSSLAEVKRLARDIVEKYNTIDVLINNAGVYCTAQTVSSEGLDVRLVVNTMAPYLLTKELFPVMGDSARVINLSSAAQAPVEEKTLREPSIISDGIVYAQSKLALTMWSFYLADLYKDNGPNVIAVNPRSMLGTKMVKEAYGVQGSDLRIGAEILYRLAVNEEFAQITGKYFDNDIGQFAAPHPDALNKTKCADIVEVLEEVIAQVHENEVRR